MKLTPHAPSLRKLYTLGAVTCLGLLAFGIYLQSIGGLEPCPLCVIQRFFIFVLGILFMIGALHLPDRPWYTLYNIAILLCTTLGGFAAWRQIALERLPPDQVPPCGPTLDVMIQQLPFRDVITQVMAGTPECSKVLWRFMGLSIPSWTLLFFICFAAIGLSSLMRK